MEDVDPYIEFSKLQNFSKKKCKCIGPSMMYYVATKNSDRRGKSKDAQILFVHIMFSGPTGFKRMRQHIHLATMKSLALHISNKRCQSNHLDSGFLGTILTADPNP
jgi:hypothetical protein